eukprot:GHVH01009233.1.p1 GENE.GHVH01009233.1~~GHVH01009233.1.p1  ORF type:complete len:918 (+),score=142.86 GHVH01009233.1:307-3060(+)
MCLKKLGSISYDYSRGMLSAPDKGLHPLFYPKSVAVIGATERPNSVGRTCMLNLINGDKGNFNIYPVNPIAGVILGKKAYKSISEIPETVDTAVVILPAKLVLSVTEECGKAGCHSLIIITAGFKEVGAEGAALEEEVVAAARRYKMRVVGPNCLGLMMPSFGMNATFAARMSLEGSLAFISQSGAMCTAALDWSIQQKVGFSCFLSIGSMADVEWSDIIEYLGEDPFTSAILIYMETIGNAQAFMSAARQVTPRKPIVVIKAGKSEAAAHAAASHTGSLAGSYNSYLAAMKRCGVLCVDTIRELFDVARVIDKQPRPLGNRLTIITNAGGPGVLATDATACHGGVVPELSPETLLKLNSFLPAAWSHGNPVDILGDASADCYARTMEVCLADDSSDGVLIVLSPQSVTEPMATAIAVVESVKALKEKGKKTKPIICSWMGGIDVIDAFTYLNQHGVPCIESPDDAAKTFCQLYEQYKYSLLAEEPAANLEEIGVHAKVADDGEEAMAVLEARYNEGQKILSEYDSKVVLKSFGIPIAETIVCESKEAVRDATKLTLFPAVVKLHSDTITHKSDVGGVILNLSTVESSMEAFDIIKSNVMKHTGSYDGFQGVTVQPMLDIASGIELLAGSVVDPQFGPLVVFGAGGCMVEIYQDTCTAIPPLTKNSAKQAIDATKISKALYGVGNARFPGVDVDKLQDCLVAFSNLVARVGDFVSEIEINPLLALKDRMVALDARVVLRSKEDVTAPIKPIIRPFPSEYHTEIEGYSIRLLKASDRRLWLQFIDRMPERSVNKRWSHMETKQSLIKKCNIYVDYDYDNVLAIAAFGCDHRLECVIRVHRIRQDRTFAQLQILQTEEFSSRPAQILQVYEFAKQVCSKEGIVELRVVCMEEDVEMVELAGFGSREGIDEQLYNLKLTL